MGSPNTGALLPITPGDDSRWRGLKNATAAELTVTYRPFGAPPETTYIITMAAREYIANDCQVTAVAGGTLSGYLYDI